MIAPAADEENEASQGGSANKNSRVRAPRETTAAGTRAGAGLGNTHRGAFVFIYRGHSHNGVLHIPGVCSTVVRPTTEGTHMAQTRTAPATQTSERWLR